MMSKWAEIRNDYVNEERIEEGVLVLSIDAWVTGDDNEEGRSIAEIVAIKKDGTVVTEIVYKDNAARIDEYAQEMIEEGIEILQESF